MAVNKVIYAGNTLVDLTGDSVTPETLAEGVTAHNASGEKIVGSMAGLPEGGEPHQMLVTDANGETKWDERPVYSEYVTQTILPESALAFSEGNGGFVITEPFSLEVGRTYTVNWNGVQYESECISVTAMGDTATVLGDVSPLVGGDSTGEPFAVVLVPPEKAEEMGGITAMVMALDGSEAVTLSIMFGGEVVKKIDLKYLPDGYPGETVAFSTLLPETNFVDADGTWVAFDPVNGAIEVGKEYAVTYNGTTYKTVCGLFNGVLPSVGNLSMLDGTGDTGEPFIVTFIPDAMKEQMMNATVAVIVFDEPSEVVVSVSGEVTVIKKLDMKYLPDGLPYIQHEDVAILEETDALAVDSLFVLLNILDLQDGTTYRVRWNGTDYVTEARIVDSGVYIGALCLGDLSIFGDSVENGLPFGIVSSKEMASNSVYGTIVIPNDGSESVRIGVFAPAGTPHKLSEDLLPDTAATKTFVAESIAAGIEVKSVNGQKGDVVITASDVGAIPVTEKTSFATQEYVNTTFAPKEPVLLKGGNKAFTATIAGVSELSDGFSFRGRLEMPSMAKQPTLNLNGFGAYRILYKDIANDAYAEGQTESWLSQSCVYTFVFKTSGSFWVVSEITGIGLPRAEATDEGKFLRVVNGAWAAVAVPNAEEVSF